MGFIATLLQYLITLVFMVLVAALGLFTGKKLRDRKDAKTADEVRTSGQD